MLPKRWTVTRQWTIVYIIVRMWLECTRQKINVRLNMCGENDKNWFEISSVLHIGGWRAFAHAFFGAGPLQWLICMHVIHLIKHRQYYSISPIHWLRYPYMVLHSMYSYIECPPKLGAYWGAKSSKIAFCALHIQKHHMQNLCHLWEVSYIEFARF